MRHILILISLLLLSPFLTSCEKNVEVVVEKKPILFRDTPYSKFVEGGKKWFKTGDEKTQVKYEGDILNGVPNGFGSFTGPNGDKFVGTFKEGDTNGEGKFYYIDGDVFEGFYKNGERNGEGTLTFGDGTIMSGMFVDDTAEGKHKMTNPDGSTEILEFKNGVLVE